MATNLVRTLFILVSLASIRLHRQWVSTPRNDIILIPPNNRWLPHRPGARCVSILSHLLDFLIFISRSADVWRIVEPRILCPRVWRTIVQAQTVPLLEIIWLNLGIRVRNGQ
jgi:hypothetical protein